MKNTVDNGQNLWDLGDNGVGGFGLEPPPTPSLGFSKTAIQPAKALR